MTSIEAPGKPVCFAEASPPRIHFIIFCVHPLEISVKEKGRKKARKGPLKVSSLFPIFPLLLDRGRFIFYIAIESPI